MKVKSMIIEKKMNPNRYILIFLILISINSCCTFCNLSTCKEKSTVVFISKEQLCTNKRLLDPPVPNVRMSNPADLAIKFETPLYQSTYPNECGQSNMCGFVLIGYYIVLNETLNSPNNLFNFIPIWSQENGNTINEILGQPIVIAPNHYSNAELQVLDNPEIIPGTALYAEALNNTFDFNVLQFSSLAYNEVREPIFDRAYVSWYELKMIMENCDHLGIIGAKVSTGNIVAKSWSDERPAELSKTCSRDYFTYRLVGFKEFDSKEKKKIFVRSDAFKQEKSSTSFSVPTETWAVPCPPMWKPSN